MPQNSNAPDGTTLLGWFTQLSPDEADQLAKQAVEFLDSDDSPVHKIGIELLQRLACFRTAPLPVAYCQSLIEREVFWPSSLYRDSGDAVAEQLVLRVETSLERLSLNHLLLALAWTRSAAAKRAFLKWSTQPPEWTSELHVTPAEYLPGAGWTLENGERRDLMGRNCFRLAPAKRDSSRIVHCRVRTGKRCPSCGGPLAWLFDFSKIPARYFSREFAEAPRRLLCCLHCACYEPVFTSYRDGADGEWLSGHEPCEFPYAGGWEACSHALEEAPIPPFACAEPFGLQDASTFGGIPTWLQDADYPRCLECSRLMTFLAQHDNGSHREEGVYYAFFCALCRIAAVAYQQT
jgi:hypothetical protein